MVAHVAGPIGQGQSAPSSCCGATAEVQRLRGLLGRLEWLPNYAYGADGTNRICFVCDSLEGIDHAPGCWLAAELDRTQNDD